MKNTATIVIEPVDVSKWRLFQEHYEEFSKMKECGVFTIRYGEVALHFTDGVLDFITKSERHKVIP